MIFFFKYNNLLGHDKTLKAWPSHYPSMAEKKHIQFEKYTFKFWFRQKRKNRPENEYRYNRNKVEGI